MTRRPLLPSTTFSRGPTENSPARFTTHHQTRPFQPRPLLKRLAVFRSRGMIAALFAAALAGCGPRNYTNHIELVTSSDSPTPTMTFELRFESIMAKGDEVGLPATNSPLVIQPRLAGTFTWLSSRSGVFTPKE